MKARMEERNWTENCTKESVGELLMAHDDEKWNFAAKLICVLQIDEKLLQQLDAMI
jgi:metal-responsive CopG/Arc/MetJ family transcriptional regulator